MSDELEIIADGDGLAIIGSATDVEAFLAKHELPSQELDLTRVATYAGAHSGAVLQGAGKVMQESGRWVKLTQESARHFKDGQLMKGSVEGVSRAIATGDKSGIKKILEIEMKAGAIANPAGIAALGVMMAQMAQQQQLDELRDYLEKIDVKVDRVLENQRDAQIASLLGSQAVIDEALSIRHEVGRVSEITWSKVQGTTESVAGAQNYALLQLAALDRRAHEAGINISDSEIRDIEEGTSQWLGILAFTLVLQAKTALLELDRVMDSEPANLESHRRGLQTSVHARREKIRAACHRSVETWQTLTLEANKGALMRPNRAHRVQAAQARMLDRFEIFLRQIGDVDLLERRALRKWGWAMDDFRDDLDKSVRHLANSAVKAASNLTAVAGGLNAFTSTAETLKELLPRGSAEAKSTPLEDSPEAETASDNQ